MWYKLRMLGLIWLMRLKNEGESEEGSEDDYVEDPEYAQEDNGILIDEQGENHLLRKGRKHVEIDVEDEDMEDEGDENNGIQLNKRNKRFKKEKFLELLEFRAKTDMGKEIFDLVLSFVSGKLFKQEIREYTLCEGKDIFFKKNDPHRVRAQCKGVNCPWMCYASKIDDSPTFVIKSYEKELRVNKDYVLEISRNKAYRARLLATKTIEGSYEEQYAALWDYAEEIKYTNKGSTIEFLTEHAENGVPRFKRMYLCYPGLRDSFNEGSRPVIGLNGCHIKGVHLSQLLTTIGVDGNNQMFPVAFTVVKIENKDLWSWFLNLLRIDLKIENSNHWTFITAEQKRLEQSLKGMWDERVPEAEHRHCARHL
ncbi:uncharacterized protein LOC115695282 [Cannabis sativa]|uniref:uncharacterized protein LOC115695282 n=1 Tax=Cannabis sativa TaxID=3483 RepID=UPI0011DFE174|nr:uncharacterized protein LOC115695282 [Cannabis sativa]